jgi:antitoxin component of MazEF toxin-antitoxin module
MKVTIRRIGNSLGIILPQSRLQSWGVGEGDALDLTERGIAPPNSGGLHHAALDELKRLLSLAVVRDFTSRQIRAQSAANLERWKRQGAWVGAYDEWLALIERGNDGALYAAMLGRDDDAVRLRLSMPYVGLLPPEEVRRLNEKAAA